MGQDRQSFVESPSRQSRWALNGANFFLADMTAVVLPFLGLFLRAHGWRYDAIGLATAAAGLGVLVMQTPAGLLVDRLRQRRLLLGVTAAVVGVTYALLPRLPQLHAVLVGGLLALAGAASAFFVPLLGALALGLVGRARLDRTLGMNQAYNHAGNIAAALAALWLVGLGVQRIFDAVAVASALTLVAVFLIRPREVDEARAIGREAEDKAGAHGLRTLLHQRQVVWLLVSVALFHLANAPAMPLVALALKAHAGSERQVALVVGVAQLVMIPVALLAGWASSRLGRKPTFAVAVLVLPVRIALYALARTPGAFLGLQLLDGVGAGIYGVVIVSMCADLTRGKGGFNGLMGLMATALAAGGVLGPLSAGFVVQHLGFTWAFLALAGVAAAGAAVFLLGVSETALDTPRSARQALVPAGAQR